MVLTPFLRILNNSSWSKKPSRILSLLGVAAIWTPSFVHESRFFPPEYPVMTRALVRILAMIWNLDARAIWMDRLQAFALVMFLPFHVLLLSLLLVVVLLVRQPVSLILQVALFILSVFRQYGTLVIALVFHFWVDDGGGAHVDPTSRGKGDGRVHASGLSGTQRWSRRRMEAGLCGAPGDFHGSCFHVSRSAGTGCDLSNSRIHPLHIPPHACARELPDVAAALRASAASVFGGAPALSARSSRSFAAVVAASAVRSAVTAAGIGDASVRSLSTKDGVSSPSDDKGSDPKGTVAYPRTAGSGRVPVVGSGPGRRTGSLSKTRKAQGAVEEESGNNLAGRRSVGPRGRGSGCKRVTRGAIRYPPL